jgi:streptogramin lyase
VSGVWISSTDNRVSDTDGQWHTDGIVTGPDGNLWFTEGPDQSGFVFKIGRLTANGILTEFATPGGAAFPKAIVAGPDGNLWYTRYYESPRGYAVSGAIGRITTQGISEDFPTNVGPRDITVGPDGTSGSPTGSNALGAGDIARITTTGVITEYAIPTANSGAFNIVAGPDGNLWFTESHSGKIGRITPDGSITEFPLPSAIRIPGSIVVGPDSALWFTEYDPSEKAGFIARITLSGSVMEFPTTGHTESLTSGPDGNLWFTEIDANRIGRITPIGSITEFAVPTPNSFPSGITSGPDGNIWFTEGNNKEIGRVTVGIFLGSPGRFRATVVWTTQGNTSVGNTYPITSNTGAFWFFDPTNLELVVKVLDGREIDGHFWVFYGSLTNVEFTLTVTDTQTGAVKTYFNPQGTLASVADTSAF